MPNDIEVCRVHHCPFDPLDPAYERDRCAHWNSGPECERVWFRPVGEHLLHLKDCDCRAALRGEFFRYDHEPCGGSGRVIDAEVWDFHDGRLPGVVIPLEGGDE